MTKRVITSVIPDLDWIDGVDPNKIFEILVRFSCIKASRGFRKHFMGFWRTKNCELIPIGVDMFGPLGPCPVLSRGRRCGVELHRHVPGLEVSIWRWGELGDKGRRVIEETNEELLKLLISAGLRRQL